MLPPIPVARALVLTNFVAAGGGFPPSPPNGAALMLTTVPEGGGVLQQGGRSPPIPAARTLLAIVEAVGGAGVEGIAPSLRGGRLVELEGRLRYPSLR